VPALTLANIVSELKGSIDFAQYAIEDVFLQFDKEIQMKELNKIRLPYATLHTLQNSLMSVNDSLLYREVREDDHFLCEDAEPESAIKDYHVPATNKIVLKPAPPIVAENMKTPTVAKKLSTKRVSSGSFIMKQGTLSRQKMKENEKSIVDDISESDTKSVIKQSERQSVARSPGR